MDEQDASAADVINSFKNIPHLNLNSVAQPCAKLLACQNGVRDFVFKKNDVAFSQYINDKISIRDDRDATQDGLNENFPIYVGIAIGGGILVCLVIILVILLYKKGTFRRFRRRESGLSTRRLYFRGFSTVSQRGVIDSTAEFEIVNTMSVSSEDGAGRNRRDSKSDMTPKKPERKKTRTSSSNVKYENVTLDGNAGFVVRKSVSMSSGIPYMDNTLESRISEKDEDLDDVFH